METIHADSVEELFEVLRPEQDRWRESTVIPSSRPLWLYRGQRDASWSLRPSRHRSASVASRIPSSSPLSVDPAASRILEHAAVQSFLSIADIEGLVPEVPVLEGGDGPWFADISVPVPQESMSAFALAQHHGVETRLLDWTTDYLAAVWFAAEGSWNTRHKEGKSAKDLAIWVMTHLGSKQVRVLRPPLASNNYMRRQSGRFTVHVDADSRYLASRGWISHDELIVEDEEADDGTVGTGGTRLFKIVAPASLDEELMIALWYRGITRVSLMPSLDNAAIWSEEQSALHNAEFPPTGGNGSAST